MDEETVYHEAGHAYMAHRCGARVELITVEPLGLDGPDRYGSTTIVWPTPDPLQAPWLRRMIQVALAGPVAEMIYRQEPWHPALVPEWAEDWATAWQLAERVAPQPQRRLQLLERLSSELHAILFLDEHWHGIATLADHLSAHETLEADQLTHIFAEISM